MYWRENWKNYIGNRDFIDGIIAGVIAFAVWKDGTQKVGVMQRPLKDEIEDIKKEMEYEFGER
jgi:hypothetical protein